jgi:hypothetical protein
MGNSQQQSKGDSLNGAGRYPLTDRGNQRLNTIIPCQVGIATKMQSSVRLLLQLLEQPFGIQVRYPFSAECPGLAPGPGNV